MSLPADPRLIDRTDAIEFLENEYPRLNLVHFKNLWDPSRPLSDVLTAISRANDEVVDAAGYRALADAMLTAASNDEEREAAEAPPRGGDCLRRLRASQGRPKAASTSATSWRCRSGCANRCRTSGTTCAALYEHILVDEYQDVNRSSVRLLKAIAGDGRNLWAVGDVKQSIYRFRGASAFNMARFDREDFKGGRRGRLTRNYRSVGEIVDAFLTFAAEMPSVRGSDVRLQAERGRSRPASRVQVGRDRRPRGRGGRGGDRGAAPCGLLVPRPGGPELRKRAARAFAKGLERLGIPVLYLGSLFERDEIKDLLSLLSILVDRRAMGLLRVAVTDTYAVPLADVALVLSHLKDHDCEPLKWVEALDAITELSLAGRDGLRRIARLLDGFASDADPWAVLCAVLLDRTRIAAEIATADGLPAEVAGRRDLAVHELPSNPTARIGPPDFPACSSEFAGSFCSPTNGTCGSSPTRPKGSTPFGS